LKVSFEEKRKISQIAKGQVLNKIMLLIRF